MVFVLSGYQNPKRGQLRDTAVALGATFMNDWDAKCTHLVCAVPNTPKYNQVVQAQVRPHRVYIVNAQFIDAAQKAGKKISESNFSVGLGVLDPVH